MPMEYLELLIPEGRCGLEGTRSGMNFLRCCIEKMERCLSVGRYDIFASSSTRFLHLLDSPPKHRRFTHYF